MPKTIFGTSEKSNFILNLDLDRYRAFCVKMLLIAFWATAASMGLNQLTYSVNGRLAEMAQEGGFATVLALVTIALRSIATVFSICGVFVVITMIVGIMRKQATKRTTATYCIVLASLLWAVYSMFHSFNIKTSLFGMDGRDEGWFALVMYGGFFFLGTMLRRKENTEKLFGGLMIFGIVQCAWGILQAQPFFEFPSEFRRVEPLMMQDLRLPTGLTDNPITYAMLLGLMLAVSIPAAVCSDEKKHRTLGTVCSGLSLLMVFKTHTVAGLIVGIAAVLFALILWAVKRKNIKGKAWLMPVVTIGAAALSVCWVCFSPSINGSKMTSNDEPLSNGYALYDGGIVWDDSFYRLSTSGPFNRHKDESLDINDPFSILGYCWSEGVRVIGLYPLDGTGPDNWRYTQLHVSMELMENENNIDRPYNDLLFIAATRGVISLVLHIILLGTCLVMAWHRKKQHGSWYTLAACAAVIIYTLSSLVGISVLTVAPIFWALLGTVAAEPLAEKVKKSKKQAKES